jgi:hypothetical protein
MCKESRPKRGRSAEKRIELTVRDVQEQLAHRFCKTLDGTEPDTPLDFVIAALWLRPNQSLLFLRVMSLLKLCACALQLENDSPAAQKIRERQAVEYQRRGRRVPERGPVVLSQWARGFQKARRLLERELGLKPSADPFEHKTRELNARDFILGHISQVVAQDLEDDHRIHWLSMSLRLALEEQLGLAPPKPPDGKSASSHAYNLCSSIVRRELSKGPSRNREPISPTVWKPMDKREATLWREYAKLRGETANGSIDPGFHPEAKNLRRELARRLLQEGAKAYGSRERILHPGGRKKRTGASRDFGAQIT